MSFKIFEVIPVLKTLFQTNDRSFSTIECFTYSNTILYIGTSDGFILRYSVNESRILETKIEYNCVLIDFKQILQKKPISKLKISNDLQRILCLSDNTLSILNFSDLETCQINSFKLKNVTTFDCNESSESPKQHKVELCVCVRGRTIQLFSADTDGKFILTKDTNLNTHCNSVEFNGDYVCLTCETQYLLLKTSDMTIQSLFTFNMNFKPFVASYLNEGFLLNGPSNLGMFVKYSGQALRAPISWSDNCQQFQILYPYLACLHTDSIDIYNIVNSKLKQRLRVSPAVKCVKYFEDEKLFLICTPYQICAVVMESLHNQIEYFLKNKEIDEALQLFEFINPNTKNQQANEKVQELKKIAGLIELFVNWNFDDARKYFLEANLDYKELACHIPDLCFQNAEIELIKSLQIKNYSIYFKEINREIDESHMDAFKSMLIDYMLICKTNINDYYMKVLFKLCSTTRPKLLCTKEFLDNIPLDVALDNLNILNDHKQYHAIALIKFYNNNKDDALNLWKQLVDGQIKDSSFPGIDYLFDILCNLDNAQLVWKYIDWALKIDQDKAVNILIKQTDSSYAKEHFKYEVILDYLIKHEVALIAYLEFLIYVKRLDKEKYHTYLAMIYLDKIIELLKTITTLSTESKVKLDLTRSKLQFLLQNSSIYRVQLILGKMKDHQHYLVKESVILYSKIDEHEKALKLLVNILKDYVGAIEYCLNNSANDSKKLRKKLFHILFSIYMEKNETENGVLLKQTLDLLNNNANLGVEFDVSKVIEVIPLNWSIFIMKDFLQHSIHTILVDRHKTILKKSLILRQNLDLKIMLCNTKSEKIRIDENSVCAKCNEKFDSNKFIRLPNGLLIHTSCNT